MSPFGAIVASERRVDLSNEDLRIVYDSLLTAERDGSALGFSGTTVTLEVALLNVRREIRSREGRGAPAP